MRLLVKLRSFLRNLFSSHDVEVDDDEEVHSRRQIKPVKEQLGEEPIRNWLHSVISDCGYGARQLRKNPGFTRSRRPYARARHRRDDGNFQRCVWRVAAGRCPIADPNRIMAVFEVNSKGRPSRLADPNFDDFRDQSRSFQAIAKYAA